MQHHQRFTIKFVSVMFLTGFLTILIMLTFVTCGSDNSQQDPPQEARDFPYYFTGFLWGGTLSYGLPSGEVKTLKNGQNYGYFRVPVTKVEIDTGDSTWKPWLKYEQGDQNDYAIVYCDGNVCCTGKGSDWELICSIQEGK